MKYTGGCHCQSVRYEVELDIKSHLSCNCSICQKKGHLLVFAPEQNFKLLSGEETLSDYQFNKKVIHHYFCNRCGVNSFGKGSLPDGTKMASINVRCLDNIDLKQFPVTEYDGRSH